MKATDITIILDRSGSMQSTKKDAIGGFNSFVESQKKVDGEAYLSLVQFDDQYIECYAAKPLEEVALLDDTTFVPRGTTALVDAIGRTVTSAEARIKKIKKEHRPNMIVVIITDGGENASREFKSDDVNKLIAKLRKKDWQFVFIGANQDAIKTASSYGISGASSLTYASNSAGTRAVFDSLATNTAMYRCGVSTSMSFSDSDRKKQEDAGVK